MSNPYLISAVKLGMLMAIFMVPIVPSHTSAKLVFFLVLLIPMQSALGNMSIDKKFIHVFFAYLILFFLSIFEFQYDYALFMQFATTIAFGLLAVLMGRGASTNASLYLVGFTLFFILALFNFKEMAFAFALGVPRIDILSWQRDTNFMFGINRYLLALFVLVCTGLVAINKKKFFIYAIVIFYLVSAVYLGSRGHSLISTAFLLYFIISANIDNGVGRFIYLFSVAAATQAVFHFIIKDEQMMGLIELYERFESLVVNDDGPRNIILKSVLNCMKNGEVSVIGNALSVCANSDGVQDYDNTLLAVISYSGIMGGIVFAVFLAWSLVIMYKLNTPKSLNVIMAISFVVVLSMDVLLARPVIFLPLMLAVFDSLRNNPRDQRYCYG